MTESINALSLCVSFLSILHELCAFHIIATSFIYALWASWCYSDVSSRLACCIMCSISSKGTTVGASSSSTASIS